VEFALVSTLLFIILFGLIEFGIAFSQYEVYVSAPREGARLAAVRCPPTPPCGAGDISGAVTGAAVGYTIGPGTPTADIACDDTAAANGDSVTVSWTQHFSIQIPFAPDLSFDRAIEAVFRCE